MTSAFNIGTMLGNGNTENQIKQIPCEMLVPYHNHKFELYSGERLDDMVQSIKDNGVLIPIIVQSIGNGKYEILIGHNRWNASKLAGKPTVPAIIKDGLSEDEAEMYVIESNLMQRGFDNLKISEQAAVIAMRHSQMFSQGKRNDIIRELELLESTGLSSKSETTADKLGAEYGMSKNSIARLLRIDTLPENFKELVDDGTVSIRAAVNVSYLDVEVQAKLIKYARFYKLDIKKSEQLRAIARERELDSQTILNVLTGKLNEKSKSDKKSVKIDKQLLDKYFEQGAKAEEISATIERALEEFFKNQKE